MRSISDQTIPKRSQDRDALIPTSEVLQDLLDYLPPDHFTLGWLLRHLHRRSFGVIVLVLALIAMVPGISASLVSLFAPAIEMIAGRAAPTFPRQIADRSSPARHLVVVVRRMVPTLKHLERAIRPRWQIPVGAQKRLVGVAVLLLTLLLLLTPLPLVRIGPGAGHRCPVGCISRRRASPFVGASCYARPCWGFRSGRLGHDRRYGRACRLNQDDTHVTHRPIPDIPSDHLVDRPGGLPNYMISAGLPGCPLWVMCGRPRVGKAIFTFAVLVGAAMCSAFECGLHDRWP